jgi:hypothetical protein
LVFQDGLKWKIVLFGPTPKRKKTNWTAAGWFSFEGKKLKKSIFPIYYPGYKSLILTCA